MKDNVIALLLVLLTSVSVSATAAPYTPYTPYGGGYRNMPSQAETGTPAAILKEGVNKLTAFIRSGGAQNREQAMAYLEKDIAPYFDFAYMTRWSAGPAWRQMSPAQRAEMQQTIATSFLTTLAQSGAELVFQGAEPGDETCALLQLAILRHELLVVADRVLEPTTLVGEVAPGDLDQRPHVRHEVGAIRSDR